MKKRKFLKKTAAVFMAASMIVPALPAEAQNSQPKKINVNHTYTSYDITGDQKPDRIVIRAKNFGTRRSPEYKKAVFYINGRKAYTLKSDGFAYLLTVKIYQTAGGKKLVYLYFPGDNGDGPCRILLWKNGKLKTILNMETLLGISSYSFHNNGEVKKVNGRSVTIGMYGVNQTLGITQYTLKYQFQNGKLKPASRSASLKVLYSSSQETLTAAKNIPVYEKPGKKSTPVTVIEKGSNVHAEKLWFEHNREWIYITASENQKGWIPAGERLFSDAFYAG